MKKLSKTQRDRLQEVASGLATRKQITKHWRLATLLALLQAGLIIRSGDAYALTPAGIDELANSARS